MHDFSLLLIALLLSSAQLAASANPLFDFGIQGNESFVAPSDDGSSEAVEFATPFMFYGSSQTSVFVSMPFTSCLDIILLCWLSTFVKCRSNSFIE